MASIQSLSTSLFRVQRRFLATAIIALAVFCAIVARRLIYPKTSLHAATSTVGPALSYLIILGVNDTAQTTWDGSISVTGATIEIIRGWRFNQADSVSGTSSWKCSTRTSPSLNPPGPVQEN